MAILEYDLFGILSNTGYAKLIQDGERRSSRLGLEIGARPPAGLCHHVHFSVLLVAGFTLRTREHANHRRGRRHPFIARRITRAHTAEHTLGEHAESTRA
jgi:hypothetical protein